MTEFTRKRFLQYGIGAGVAFAMPWAMPRGASAA
jgi:hypothetical protein